MEKEQGSKLAVEITFRQFPVYNEKGLKFCPVELENGKIIDWNMIPGPTKRKIKKQFIGFEFEVRKQLKAITMPKEVHVYDCPKCLGRLHAFVLDEGITPEKIPCKCGYPMAEKKFVTKEIKENFKLKADLFFRHVRQEEYEEIEEDGKKYIASGGLFMELAR